MLTCGKVGVKLWYNVLDNNMTIFTLSWYIKAIRKYSKNCRQSLQNVLSTLFGVIYNDKTYFVESSISSRIMNGEYDVPYNIRETYNIANEDNRKLISDKFINQMIDQAYMDNLIREIKEVVTISNISSNYKEKILNENNPFEVLSYILNIVIISDNRKSLKVELYKTNNGIIRLISGDIISIGFNKKVATNSRIVVIPVDDKFTMVLKNQENEEIISKDSIHGKWLLRMNKKGIKKPKIKYIQVNDKMKIGKCKVDMTEFYLIPISSLKERFKAESTLEVIKNALFALSLEYNISGQGTPLFIPIIGTGRARTNLSYNDSISLIKNTFINNKNGFFGEVNIVIYSKVIDKLGGSYNGL